MFLPSVEYEAGLPVPQSTFGRNRESERKEGDGNLIFFRL